MCAEAPHLWCPQGRYFPSDRWLLQGSAIVIPSYDISRPSHFGTMLVCESALPVVPMRPLFPVSPVAPADGGDCQDAYKAT